MVSVYMNPENLDRKIASLKKFAESVKGHNGTVNGKYNNEPIVFGEDHLKPIHTAIDSAADEITAHVSKLTDCKTTMVNLNSNGVASHDLEGGISIEVPDDSAGLETTDKFQKWAQGATDANDLTHPAPGGKTPSGRTYDEVVESMKANQDDSTYANSVVDKVGPKNFSRLPAGVHNYMSYDSSKESYLDVEKRFSQLFGSVLATASQTWDKDKSEKMSQAITSSVAPKEGKDNWRYMRYINAMLGGHDSNGDHVNDLKFGKDFLVSMGDNLEELPWDEIRKYYANPADESQRNFLGGWTTDHWSYDPLSGVLDAMGNNPDAALEFLSPSDGSNPDRFEKLSKREWEHDGFSGYTAALAAASSKRGPDSSDEERARADALTGNAIHSLRVGSTMSSEGKQDLYYRPDTKARVGMLLANCAPELASDWGAAGPAMDMRTGKVLPGVDVGKRDPKNKQKTVLGDFDVLAYRVADSQDAVATISAGIGAYAKSGSQEVVSTREGDREGQLDGIKAVYRSGEKAVGYLVGMSDQRIEEINRGRSEHDKVKSDAASTAVGLFFTAATVGLSSLSGPVGTAMGTTAAKLATPAVTTFLKPIVASAITGEGEQKISHPGLEPHAEMQLCAIQDAANAGLLNPNTFDPKIGFNENWKVEDENGKIVGSDGKRYRLDFSRANSPEDVNAWMGRSEFAVTNDPNMQKIRQEAGHYADGNLEGAAAGRLAN
ncbi:DUF6571 family protein [uncultured Actinomyces sp.]|uniref:DUF6571 family protein n=1 Tax=uncultured Actinomyces sp. TaxID=249061 RepID=UPI0028D6B126|nr:DUF6571 family protein [uncultured Actinomyces sp.]